MDKFVLEYESEIRLAIFLGMFITIAVWELTVPRRRLSCPRLFRWSSNLGIVVLNTISLRLVFPAAAIGVSAYAMSRGWGLFNILLLPNWIEAVLSILALDLLIYWQHVVFHRVPLLWRVHRVYHTDLDFDVTTGVRFHPVEILLSMIIKMLAVVILGAGAVAVLIFELVLNASSMFNHGNVHLPLRADKALRLILVTPDMHRVHHSTLMEETNSNFGFNLPWWDYIFDTYRSQPRAGHDGMTLGLCEFRDLRKQSIWDLVVLPFVRNVVIRPQKDG